MNERLRYLLFGRVLMMTVFLAAVGALWFREPAPSRVLFGDVTFMVIALGYAGTVLSAFLVRSTRRPVWLAYLQIVFDVLLITGALGALRAADGPFAVLYALPIANAAGILMLPGAVVAAVASSGAFAVALLHQHHLAVASGAVPGAGIAGSVALASVCFGLIAAGVGGVARRLAVAEDELTRRRSEVAQLEELHRALADGLESGILVTDCEGRVRSANPAAQQILSLPISSIIGREITWLLPLLESAEPVSEPSAHLECEQRAGGQSRRLRVRRSALGDTYGNAIGELIVVQDMTRIEELEAQLAPDESGALLFDDDQSTPSGDDDQSAVAKEEMPAGGPGAIDGLIGRCPEMVQVSHLVDKVAAADATVLITGESGTGKELVARAIHRRSARAGGPFVVVNCGAIPETLIESELFGHVRGAFTGAVADRPGLFRRAHGGTIFLDEIGELSLALQVRLLRVLQDHKVLPVGGTLPVDVDVRVIAATNRVLEDLVKSGNYREDLYYRLAVISIDVPPLRQRDGDLPLLIEHFVREAARRHGRSVRGVSARAMARLVRHPYAGNVRELENVVEHAITLTDGDTVREVDLPDSVRGIPTRLARKGTDGATLWAESRGLPSMSDLEEAAGPDLWPDDDDRMAEAASPSIRLPIDDGQGMSLDEQLARQEKGMLLAALDRAAGVKKKAAALLGINYRSFRHRLQKYGLDGHGETSLSADETLPRETRT